MKKLNRKFRGKHLTSGKWIFGTSIVDHGDKGVFIYPEEGLDSPDNYEVHRESVGVFTGWYDTEGVEIYEGDFIVDSDSDAWLVEYYEDYGAFVCWQIIEGKKHTLQFWHQSDMVGSYIAADNYFDMSDKYLKDGETGR